MTTKLDHQRNDNDASSTPEDTRAAVRYAQWVYAALATASFAPLLTILAQEWDDPVALRALLCFAIAIPLFSGAAFVYGEPRRMYRVSMLMGFIPVLAVPLFVAGVALLIGRVHTVAAGAFIVASLAQLWIVVSANHRHRVRARTSDTVLG